MPHDLRATNSTVPPLPSTSSSTPLRPLQPKPVNLTELSLPQLLAAMRRGHCAAQAVRDLLLRADSAAGRELRDACRMRDIEACEALVFSMASLLGTPAKDRTLAQLDECGIFVTPSRRLHLRRDEADLLLSDQGLLLWLQYAASPSAYPSVFIDTIMNECITVGMTGMSVTPEASATDSRLGTALRVLVACGRDTTNDVAASEMPGHFHPPLSHLCSVVAPEWLPRLLAFGADANQRAASGVPLLAAAMAAEAERLHHSGHHPLILHESLYRLGALLLSNGALASQPAPTASPPAMLLALNGYCAAAEAVLSLGETCNVENHDGNTLMHHLAAATQHTAHSFAAFFLFTVALRYGGDPGHANHAGATPIALLSSSLVKYVRLYQAMLSQARERARHLILTGDAPTASDTDARLSPLTVAMQREAKRLCDAGHDPLLPHASLFQTARALLRPGADREAVHRECTLPIVWLGRHGYCGAAEVLLSLHPDAGNAPDDEGNTLMHYLAGSTRAAGDPTHADYLLNVAMRYGADPNRANRAGTTPLAMLGGERARFVRATHAFVAETQRRAQWTIAHRRQRAAPAVRGAGAAAPPMRHSAASQ
ncbi:ankyrin [Pandoraea morbifera]|uniref:Ankyrin n=1 Tax=Pandoraea morbifera TaxID=2508300 RepID=A0A5E4UKT9_9BURK|nr:ankyrin [Pandoraea morbifera]